jgi:predicted short-subunit dehydrogenase-like oxidoreductase (DUF2520 family)
MRLDRARIGIIGAGRLGTAVASALRATGVDVVGPFGRGASGDGCDIVYLCVPDAEIAPAARMIQEGRLVGHASGATSLAPLAPHEAFSAHPLISVSKSGAQFAGAGCAVAGTTERARSVASQIAAALGMRPFEISESDRALYHAAASLASNYFVTLESAAERVFAKCGVSRDHIVPLVQSALDHWADIGGRDALTGPVVRHDDETVARQREALAARAPELVALWDVMTAATRTLAREPASAT